MGGPIVGLGFFECTRPVVVHKQGSFGIEHIAGTTNGTVASLAAEVTFGTAFGTANCKTGVGTDIGTLTGVKAGLATLDVNAVLNCGFLVPSAIWQASYTITIPERLGVSA